ncbi:MAG: UDP-N-acetylglucosamine 1-carboxyvinyltransferase [Clostridia bacterium]|nr:UDP-N-acetylglucosamine 1-carboxyvinyltransferase [Clostridia bacterium]
MTKYVINGGRKLEGCVDISGSKNSALPIIAASVLNGGKTTLYNVPAIHDTEMMFKILNELGGKVVKKNNKVIIDTSKINSFEIPEGLMREMRSSVIFAGAILGRYRKVTFSYPGGCDIGSRPIDLHIAGFKKLGINIEENAGYIICNCDKIEGIEIQLDFPSVGATENLMLASVLAEGKTVINNVAMEPEIVDLQNFLNKMGAKVSGAGSGVIVIEGVKKLKDVSYNIMPDRIETGTFLCYAASTGGMLELNKTKFEHIQPVIAKLEEANCKVFKEKNRIIINSPKKLKAVDIKTMPYPGFPTDMQSVFLSMLTIAKGTSIITENIFENRFKCGQELKRMGAKISVDCRTAVVKGVRRLYGTTVKATDLRGGAALVLAGLVAHGETVVENVSYIKRGYENLDKKLTKIGGRILEVR